MNRNDRQRLVSMVRGEDGRELLFRFYPKEGEPRREFVKVEGNLPPPDPDNPFRFMFADDWDEFIRSSSRVSQESD